MVTQDIKNPDVKLVGLGATGSAIVTVVAYLVGLLTTRVITFRVTPIKGNYRILLYIATTALMEIYFLLFFKTKLFIITIIYKIISKEIGNLKNTNNKKSFHLDVLSILIFCQDN